MAAGFRSPLAFWLGGAGKGTALPPATAGFRSMLGLWIGGGGQSGTSPPPPPTVAGRPHKHRWTIIPWDESFFRDRVQERNHAKREIKRLLARTGEIERRQANQAKRALAQDGPALLAAPVELGPTLERLNAARARMAEAELAMAAWKAQRDEDDLEVMLWLL